MIRRMLAVALAVAVSNAVAADEPVSAPFITSPDEVVQRMLQFAHTGPDDVVVDLGSGDGRIVIAAAQKFGARGLGIEIDAGLVRRSRENALKAGVGDRVTFQQGDVLAADISAASVVTVYLLPGLINRLPPVFLRLNPGTRIVSHAFAMAGWRPDAVETVRVSQPHPGQGPESTLYLWVVPAEVRGIWEGDGRAADGTRIRIHQNFQEVELEGQLLGRKISASRASLRGRDIMWEANGLRFQGRLQGEVITGELAGPD